MSISPTKFRTRTPSRRSSTRYGTRGCASAPRQGANLVGAARLARELGPGHTIVTMMTDSGLRYQSRLFNPEFLRSRQLPVPPWLAGRPDPLPTGVLT